MKGICELGGQSEGGFKRCTGYVKDALLEFGHQVDDLAAVGGEDVGMLASYACDQTLQAQTPQVIAHLAGGYRLQGAGQKAGDDLAHVGVAEAIQAGREIRVIVRQEDITDAESFQLSRELAKKIEQELTYPGQIKVTVIRESRYVEYAR